VPAACSRQLRWSGYRLVAQLLAGGNQLAIAEGRELFAYFRGHGDQKTFKVTMASLRAVFAVSFAILIGCGSSEVRAVAAGCRVERG
jgi:hypothetical protein